MVITLLLITIYTSYNGIVLLSFALYCVCVSSLSLVSLSFGDHFAYFYRAVQLCIVPNLSVLTDWNERKSMDFFSTTSLNSLSAKIKKERMNKAIPNHMLRLCVFGYNYHKWGFRIKSKNIARHKIDKIYRFFYWKWMESRASERLYRS